MGWQPLRVASVSSAAKTRPNREAFLRLAMTHAAVMAGDAIVTVALAGSIFFSTDVNGARGRVLLSLVLTMAPFAVVAPLLGPAIDKSKGGRRLMVIVSAAGRCLTCLYMARVTHNLLLFLPSALVLLILSKAHAVAKSALVPATVESPEDLVEAGGRLAVLAAVSGFVAAALAAGVLNVFNAAWVLRLAAVAYGVGAVMALRTRPAPPAQPSPPDHVDEYVRSRGVTLAAMSMAGLRAVSGFLTFAIAFSFRRTHAPTWWFGVVVAAAVLGGFIGSVIGPRLRQVIGEERILSLALAGIAFVGLTAAYFSDRSTVALVALTVGIANGIGRLAFDAIVQRDGSEGSRGRSFARFEASFQLAWVAAAVLPVAIAIPSWVASLVVGVASAAALVNYGIGRAMAARVQPGHPDRPAPGDDQLLEPAGHPPLGPASQEVGEPDRSGYHSPEAYHSPEPYRPGEPYDSPEPYHSPEAYRPGEEARMMDVVRAPGRPAAAPPAPAPAPVSPAPGVWDAGVQWGPDEPSAGTPGPRRNPRRNRRGR